MRLTALKSKEVDETGVCTNQKGRAQTTTSTDRGAEPSFLGRPGPAQTKWQSPLSQADRDQRRPSGRASSQNGTSHPLGPFRGNAGGMGAFGGISGHKPVGTKADQDQQDQDQHGPRGRALVPRKAGRAGFLAISGPKPVGTMADQDQHRPGPARTVGQSPLSQADQDQRLNVDRSHHTRGVRTP